jgi:hypothetical protein
MIHDFSQATVFHLYEVIDSIRRDDQWRILDFFTDLFEKVPDLSQVQAYRREVLDKYDVAESDLDQVITTLRQVDADYEMQIIDLTTVADELTQKIRNLADMITPAVVSFPPDQYAIIGHQVAQQFAAVWRGVAGGVIDDQAAIDQTLDEQTSVWEKLANAVGGFAYSVVDKAVLGGVESFDSAVDAVFGTRWADDMSSTRRDTQQWVNDHWITNEQWFFGGQAVGDAVVCAAGVVTAIAGVITIAGSITTIGAGLAATATGIGAPIGAAAIAISAADVVVGTAELGVGIAWMKSGGSSIHDDWAAMHRANDRNLEQPEITYEHTEPPGTLTGNCAGLNTDERKVVDELLHQGRDIEIIPRSIDQGVPTPDFKVDGIPTELKTITGTSLNTPVTKIQKGFKQGKNVILDARQNSAITKKEAENIFNRIDGIYKDGIPGEIEIWTIDGIIRR